MPTHVQHLPSSVSYWGNETRDLLLYTIQMHHIADGSPINADDCTPEPAKWEG